MHSCWKPQSGACWCSTLYNRFFGLSPFSQVLISYIATPQNIFGLTYHIDGSTQKDFSQLAAFCIIIIIIMHVFSKQYNNNYSYRQIVTAITIFSCYEFCVHCFLLTCLYRAEKNDYCF